MRKPNTPNHRRAATTTPTPDPIHAQILPKTQKPQENEGKVEEESRTGFRDHAAADRHVPHAIPVECRSLLRPTRLPAKTFGTEFAAGLLSVSRERR